ncbi:decarboxylating NADP(+)-dependent phosphogluconate dehydrogenase [Thalassotalea sp. PLHSN55]|uniref:decarboxylating NADP(+)-dependent phosphogluconate dehydrogenase n=1 Tax=Thalassotalea sp. PLHSN55 TaxID=3435888 RepID=UPI003F833B96
MSNSCDIAVVGLAVMGQNLILNMNDNGFKVAAYNRTTSKVDDFINGAAKGTNIVGVKSIEEMVASLSSPRKIMLMVKAGEVVDKFIEQIVPHLDKGDIIIDGGNADYNDSIRRYNDLDEKGLLFIGTGVSGGEEGARFGPAIMPGGHKEAWPHVKNIFQAIAAKTDDGTPCCDWVGDSGSGHFVKMVHNGIEYGDMQLICEAYQFMKDVLNLDNLQIQQVFEQWKQGELGSYLIDITADIMGTTENGEFVIDKILDKAGQKGTGKMTGINALEFGVPVTLICEAVFSRCISALKDERIEASEILTGPEVQPITEDQQAWIDTLGQALYASKIISYAQGFMLMREASNHFNWNLNNSGVAMMWSGGCIIRSVFLKDIKNAYDNNPALTNLTLDSFFSEQLITAQPSWRKAIAQFVLNGVPAPAMSAGLAFYDSYRHATLPANLLQAQRDYFGAHTYERTDKPRGEFFHTKWTANSGDTASSTYDA